MEATQETRQDVVVVGAGLAGLIAGALVARSGTSVTIVDHAAIGGRARTTERDGFRFNHGPHAVYIAGALAAALGDLAIALPGGPPATTTSSVVYRGEVHRLPGTPALMLKSGLVGLRDKARIGTLLARLPRIDTAALADRSGEQWLAGLGMGEAATDLVRMLTRIATYSSTLDRLSADAAVVQLRGAATGPGVRYVDGGWQRLVDQVAARATEAGARIVGDAAVRTIDEGPGGFRVTTDGPTLVARAVIMAAGSPAVAGRLLPGQPEFGGLGPAVTAACIDLGLAAPPSPLALFGMDEPLYLSTHCPPADLAPPGGAVVHLMRYGATDPAADQAELWAFAARAGIGPDDAVAQRSLPHMTVAHGSPSPASGGLAGRPPVAVTGLAGAFLAGDWVGAEGVLADASAASARAAAAAAIAHVERAAVPA